MLTGRNGARLDVEGSGVRGSTGKRKHGLATMFGTVPRKGSRMDRQAPASRLLQAGVRMERM